MAMLAVRRGAEVFLARRRQVCRERRHDRRGACLHGYGAAACRPRWQGAGADDGARSTRRGGIRQVQATCDAAPSCASRSEEHTSELQSLMRISYAVFCLKKKKQNTIQN